MRLFGTLLLCGCLALGQTASAQEGLFSPVISINDAAVTGYELDQRQRLLAVFRTPGNLAELARTQLVEDRLKQQELARVGLSVPEAALRTAMEEFAGRANLSLDQFLTVLGQNGVSEETLRDYVGVGIAWRDYIRARYNSRVTITDADIDLAISQMGQASTAFEVLLTEIIIPAPPPEAARVMALAQQIAQTTSLSTFEAAAREYSALPSRDAGGRLDWVPLANFPPALHGMILGLAPGEVTPPIPIENGVALFQLRDLREGSVAPATYATIDYAAFYAAGAAEAQAVVDRIDTCNDLYGVAQGLPPEQLDRIEAAPGDIPQDIAIELARLDRDEVSTALTRNGGATVVVLMLCNRIPAAAADADREAIATRLRGERLTGYADALVQDLRASATIIGE